MIKRHKHFPPLFADKLAQASGLPIDSVTDKMLNDEISRFSKMRIKMLRDNPIAGKFDLEHLSAIHTYIFQDVSSYASSVREHTLQGHAAFFAMPKDIDKTFERRVAHLLHEMEEHTSYNRFIHSCTHMVNSINYAHPFREGNGRATRVFLE